MRRLGVLFFILFSAASTAQMLSHNLSLGLNGMPEFARTFVQEKGIHTIRGTISIKADGTEMKSTADAVYYKFNRFGELVFEYHTVYRDTIFTLYGYDERSNMTLKRTADKYGFQSHHFTYDMRNRITEIKVRQESNKGQSIELHVPDETKTVRSERFTYEDGDALNYKKLYLNEQGIAYREEFFSFDHKQRLVKQEAYQRSGSGNEVIEFTYNEKGILSQKKASNSVMGNVSYRYEYEYDELQNIYSMKYYQNDIYITEYQYVYDSSTNLLSAIIMRDVKSNVMTIVKYDFYTFF